MEGGGGGCCWFLTGIRTQRRGERKGGERLKGENVMRACDPLKNFFVQIHPIRYRIAVTSFYDSMILVISSRFLRHARHFSFLSGSGVKVSGFFLPPFLSRVASAVIPHPRVTATAASAAARYTPKAPLFMQHAGSRTQFGVIMQRTRNHDRYTSE